MRMGRAGRGVITAVCFVPIATAAFGVSAAAPKETSAMGVDLGASEAAVRTTLAALYANCNPGKLIYRKRSEDASAQTAALAINPGMAANNPAASGVCLSSPAGVGFTDSIEARFAHPDVDAERRLYSLLALREYPDAVYEQPPRVRASFDALRRTLVRTYGKPIDERREPTVSSAANRAQSLGNVKKVKREDYVVRYLWAADGRLADVEGEDTPCDCKGRYVKAVIEISRAPSTTPPNAFYVLSVKLIVEDADLRVRQDAWNAQWQQAR